jgi:hypothetical protein
MKRGSRARPVFNIASPAYGLCRTSEATATRTAAAVGGTSVVSSGPRF